MRPRQVIAPRPFELGLPIVVPARSQHARHRRPGAERIGSGRIWLPHEVPTGSPAIRVRERTLALIIATEQITRAPHWFCSETAALIWGCSTVALSGQVHLAQQHYPHRHGPLDVIRHSPRLSSNERDIVDGLPVTSLARTVVDCARLLPDRRALVIADSALRLEVDMADINDAVAQAAGSRGIVRARRLLAQADGGAESPGETIVRLVCLQEGLPRPVTQVPVGTHLGTKYVDLGWADHQVAVEFDGRSKYLELSAHGAAHAIIEEKRRQDALEEAGWLVIRVRWEDLSDPGRLAARIRAALARHRWRLGP